jgi:hypothetical protein
VDGKKKTRPWLREARWWVLLGAAYGLAGFLPLTCEPIREGMWSGLQAAGGPVLVSAVAALLPAVWTLALTAPLPHDHRLLYLALPLAALLGGAAGYLLAVLVRRARRRA